MPIAFLSELQRTQSALQQHRRQSGRRRIPEALRRQVVALLTSYPRRQVVSTLGISYNMLSHWEQAASPLEGRPDPAEPVTFVRLPVDTEPTFSSIRPLSALSLQWPDDVILTFSGTSATDFTIFT